MSRIRRSKTDDRMFTDIPKKKQKYRIDLDDVPEIIEATSYEDARKKICMEISIYEVEEEENAEN